MHEKDKNYIFRKIFKRKNTKAYRCLLIEQHPEHPHHYIDSPKEITDKTILDIGAAEGIFSLSAIEKARMIYLFEYDPKWIKALNATFEPWKDKVKIIKNTFQTQTTILNRL